MPTARAAFATSSANGKIYAIGGHIDPMANKATTSTIEVYDPKTDTWVKKVDMAISRSFLSASTVNGKIYVIGGWTNPANLVSAVEEYTPEGWPFSILLSQGKLPTKWGNIKNR